MTLLVADVHPDCNRINHWPHAKASTNPIFGFFHEIFLEPFSLEETVTMLKDIGYLMGVEIDEAILSAIHAESGGHPFISRQLTSFLFRRVSDALGSDDNLALSTVKNMLSRALYHSATLKEYCNQSIWTDLHVRAACLEMDILRTLACSGGRSASTEALIEKFSGHTEGDLVNAILKLRESCVLTCEEQGVKSFFRAGIPLLSRWIVMNLSVHEQCEWMLP
ncbi:MAG: hypothetical protein GY835_02550 [bacterium]|nr:hypothetical protein [bacterium]